MNDPLNRGSAAADRGDDVEARAIFDRRVQPGTLAVDVGVDVRAQGRTFRHQAVAERSRLDVIAAISGG